MDSHTNIAKENTEWAFSFILEIAEMTPAELTEHAQGCINLAKHIATTLSSARATFAYISKKPAGYIWVVLESMRCDTYGSGVTFATKADAKQALKEQFPTVQIMTEKAVGEEASRRRTAYEAKHGKQGFFHKHRLDAPATLHPYQAIDTLLQAAPASQPAQEAGRKLQNRNTGQFEIAEEYHNGDFYAYPATYRNIEIMNWHVYNKRGDKNKYCVISNIRSRADAITQVDLLANAAADKLNASSQEGS